MKSKVISGLVLLAVLLTGPQCAGQEVRDTSACLSLHDCMQYAVEHSTKMSIQRTEVEDAQVNRREAILKAFTPSISAGTYAYSNFGRTVDPETNTYISTTSFNNGYSASGSIMIFNGFTAVNNMKIAKTAIRMGHSREQQLEDEIALATMQAYYNVLYFSRMTDVFTSFVETAEKNLELVRRQKELGQKGYADQIQMEADLADRRFELTQMENKRNDALITLKDIMLWPVSEPLLIDLAMADPLSFSGLRAEEEGMNEEELADLAKSFLPSAAIARDRMENARTEWKTARWRLAPSLSLNGGWSTSYYTYPGRKDYATPSYGSQLRDNGGEYVQLSLNIPIYDRLSRHSEIARKKHAYRRAEAEYEQQLHDIEAEVARALQDREGAVSAFMQAQKRSSVQEEAFRLNKAKVAQGLISPIEYQTASNQYLKAEAQRLNALLQYHIKNSVVAFYHGISYLEQEYQR